MGLPVGFVERLQSRTHGSHLPVWLIDRIDQIHFKLYAAADQGPGQHVDDLLGLKPTDDELIAAARWTFSHDVSPGFRSLVRDLLQQLAADIARGTFYFPRTVDETLKELAASGLVKSARAGREKRYWLKPSEWSFLQTWNRPDGFPRWIDWARFLTVQERIGVVLINRDLSPTLQASESSTNFNRYWPKAGYFPPSPPAETIPASPSPRR